MKLTKLSVANYRALKDVTIPLSRFGCLIGENNSGKSSFLQAIALFFSGTKLSPAYYFDASQNIRIAITFEDISEEDLSRLAPEHRPRVLGIIKDKQFTLARVYESSGKSSLMYNALIPAEARFSQENIADLVKNQRPGAGFVSRVVQVFPELEGKLDVSMNQEAVKQVIKELADSLPDNVKVSSDLELPTGIDKSILPMLPDPIYIPAVKDLSDDIKTTESTPFGKILAILLQAVEPKLPDAKKLFEELNSKLNLVQKPDGTIVDGRLDEVKLIESTVEKYVRESFSEVALRVVIPPPELKTVFSSARIYADDGVDGVIDSKGDGLRRAVVFSILRAYVELKTQLLSESPLNEVGDPASSSEKQQVKPATASYLLLFEEPELFLHPKAQHVLFAALKLFAKDHHVLVTTHSPMFFGPEATDVFIKLRKVTDIEMAPKPFTKAQPVDLADMAAKDQFQIICFENNNAAFFADVVVLVEGDSDYLLLPHIAKVINPSWDVNKAPVLFARITGKGNIRRYREFFSRFGTRVPVISDLDLLVNGFDQIDPDQEIKRVRDELLQRVDQLVVPEDGIPSAKEAKDAHSSGELKSLWRKVKDLGIKYKIGNCTLEEYEMAVEEFFAWQRKAERLDILKSSSDGQMLTLKYKLLEVLRSQDIYVLERGAIEDYYPESIYGNDKPSKAQDFCTKMTTSEDVLACCGEQPNCATPSTKEKEFLLIFQRIFNGPLSTRAQE